MNTRRSLAAGTLARRALLAVLAGAASAFADVPITKTPFIYESNSTKGQATDPAFKERFNTTAPELYHLRSDFRYLGRFGVGGMVSDSRRVGYDAYIEETRAYTDSLHEKGVRWITPYLCNQTLSGNDGTRFGAVTFALPVKLWDLIRIYAPYILAVFALMAVGILTDLRPPVIVAFVLLAVFQNFWRPILIGRVASHADSTQTATVLSIESQAKNLFLAVVAPLLGWSIDLIAAGGRELPFLPIAALGLTVSMLMLMTGRRCNS